MSGSSVTPRRTNKAPTPWRVKLVSGDREQIDAELVHVSFNLADRLSSVGMEEDATVAGDARARLNWLDGPHLIVGMHDADEDCARRDGPVQIIRVDAPETIYSQVSYPRAQAFKKPARYGDRRMFDPRGDDVIATATP